MKRLSGLLAGLVALAFAGTASASFVTITVDTLPPPGGAPYTINFDSGFGFFDSAYPRGDDANAWATEQKWGDEFNSPDPKTLTDSSDRATGWVGIDPGGNPDGVNQAAFLDRMLEELGRPTISDIYFKKIDVEDNTFTTAREYFWVKHADFTAYFRNAKPGQEVTVIFRDNAGNAVNFSHYGVAGVPIPAAFILFGSGLVGLGWLARRQRARKDSVV